MPTDDKEKGPLSIPMALNSRERLGMESDQEMDLQSSRTRSPLKDFSKRICQKIKVF